MRTVQIKNINKTHDSKPSFAVRGRINPHPKVCNNSNGNGKHLFAILFDKTGRIRITAYDNTCDFIIEKLKTNRILLIHGRISVKTVRTDFHQINHKYYLVLNNCSIIETINVTHIEDFPKHKFTSGRDLKRCVNNKLIDITGKYMGCFISPIRQHKIKVGRLEVVLKNWDNYLKTPFNIGSKLKVFNAEFAYTNGIYYASINEYSDYEFIDSESYEDSSSNAWSDDEETLQDFRCESPYPQSSNSSVSNQSFKNEHLSPDHRPSTSKAARPSQSFKNELLSPDHRPSTSKAARPSQREWLEKTNRVISKVQTIYDSAPSEEFQQLFEALLSILINARTEEDRCDLLHKLIK